MKRNFFMLMVMLIISTFVLAACATGEEESVTPTPEPEPTVAEAVDPTAEGEDAAATEEADADADAAATEEADADADAAATEEADADADAEAGTIVEIAAADEENFSTLVAAVEAAGLVETLNGEGPFTVFAPTNAAFDAALEALGITAEELLADTETLTNILTYHVVDGAVLSGDLEDEMTVTALNGGTLTVSIADGTVMINDATVINADVEASNGVIHVIDAVLLPPAEEDADAAAAGEDADAVVTDEADADADADAAATDEADADAMTDDDMEMGTIVEIAAADEENFSTLVAAVEAAGLVETLNGEGPFTVFAPTNAAFDAAFEALGITAEELLADTETLTNILTYHVVDGAVLSGDLEDEMTVTALNGGTLTVSIEDGTVMINDATVVTADVEASNGVIHVIDTVLLPPAEEDADAAAAGEPTEVAAAGVDAEGTDVVEATDEPAEDMAPTEEPTAEPTEVPTEEPTEAPTDVPTEEPTEVPTEEPTAEPTDVPTEVPTEEPTPTVEPTAEPLTIVEIAAADEETFSTLVAAVEAADLVDILSGEGPFTVFAPTDEAFEAALESLGLTAEELLADTELLLSVLTYHVVEGAVTSDQLEDGMEVPTVNGAILTISIDEEGNVMVNDANVVAADVEAANGVIHVIDAVLLPPAEDADAAAAEGDDMATEEPTAEGDAAAGDEDASAMEEGDDAGMGGMDLAGTITSVCLVTDLGRVNDGSFNQSAYNGMVQAVEAFNLESTFIETQDQADYAANISTCLDEGFDAIITVGFLIADATLQAAQANPDVYFIGVDQFVADGPDNLVGIQFREDQAGFLAGAMAALMTESGVLGGVYGEEIPPVVKFRNGFEQGARYINPDITLLGVYIESFLAPAEGAEAAEAFIGEGADVIFGAGGPTGSGGIVRAAEQGVKVIGVDQDEYFTTFGAGETPGAENIITSAVKRVDQGVFDMLQALSAGEVLWPGGGIYLMDASVNGVGFAPANDADVPEEVTNQVQEILDMLASGELSTGVDPVTGALLDMSEEAAAGGEMAAEGDDMATEEADADADAMTDGDMEMGTIVDIAVADEANFSTLVAAVQAAGLVETLNGEGPFTVFAPTNAAFDAAFEALGITAEELLADTETLTDILTYHVVSGAVMSGVLADGMTVTALNGDTLTVSIADGTVMINDATVVAADVEASNGVIHVIDAVLLPPAEDADAAAEGEEMATEEDTAAMEEGDDAGMGGMDLAGTITSVCLVTDLGRVNDGSFNQSAFEGMVRAVNDFTLESTFIETQDQADYAANISTCLDEGYDAIITVGFLIADATLQAAQANPDVYFIGVDQFVANGPDNLVGIQFREDQAGFLAGAMAALMTESGVLGGVYGEEIPPVVKFRNGFEQGARYINPDITLLGVYIESFLAPAEGAEAAEAFIGEGADVIFGAGGPTGSGGIVRAAEQGVKVIGVDQDEYFTTFGAGETPGAENIITSAVKRVDQGVYDMLQALSAGEVLWPGGGIYLMDASVAGVGFAPANDADVPEEVTSRVQEILDMLASGELTTGVDPVTGALLEMAEE